MTKALAKIMDAHGGYAYWRALDCVEIVLSVRGFLFTAKRVPPLQHVRMTLRTARPEVFMHDYPQPGQTTRFFGDERVDIIDACGAVLQERMQPRASFTRHNRLRHWDTLDFAYFCCYAMWGYLATPFLFLREGVEIAGTTIRQDCAQLTVRFPRALPTHCACQDFYFDREHRLQRQNYTAEVVGSWARAVHLCDSYQRYGGLFLPTRRRVYPRLLFNLPFKWLTLVAIDIHDVIPHVAAVRRAPCAPVAAPFA